MKYLLFLLIALTVSCGSSKVSEGREMNAHFIVDAIEGDSATLLTLNYRIPYRVKSEGLEAGEQAFFMLYVLDNEIPREFDARIRKVFPSTDTLAIRRALKIDRSLKFYNLQNEHP